MKFSLVPQERRFYDLFAKQGGSSTTPWWS